MGKTILIGCAAVLAVVGADHSAACELRKPGKSAAQIDHKPVKIFTFDPLRVFARREGGNSPVPSRRLILQ